jgi:hypothetical protein
MVPGAPKKLSARMSTGGPSPKMPLTYYAEIQRRYERRMRAARREQKRAEKRYVVLLAKGLPVN